MTPPPTVDEVQRLKKQNEFKTQLLNSVAHELSTPLTPLRLQMHLLAQGRFGSLNKEQQQCVETVTRNVERLHDFMKELLDLARLESSRLPVNMKALDLADVALEALNDFQGVYASAGVELRTHLMRDLIVMADQRRLVQVFYSLLSNAAKFTPRGGKVDLSLSREGSVAVVSVEDTGTGFAPGDAARLFKPFAQLGNLVEGSYSGSGLGLYISQGIIDLHGGRMWGTSEGEGKGSSFGFRLPLVPTTASIPTKPVISSAQDPERVDDFERRIRNLL